METDKRYQVFVSSTYKDLQEERTEVMHALLELDCIPSGMELFPAANEDQWSLIKRVIDDCDYYVLILAGRYGSCGPDGVSYTEMEYRYAVEQGKPVIAFLHRAPDQIAQGKCELEQEGRQKLDAFRALVEKRICKQWASAAELGSVVSRSIVQLMKSNPAIGWVRADELPDKNAALELLKLRRQVDELEAELAHTRTTAPKGTEDLAQGDETTELNYSFHAWDKNLSSADYTDTFAATWNVVFSAIAPAMINEASERSLKQILDSFAMESNQERLEKQNTLVGRELSRFSLNLDNFQTIKVQLRALGLIVKSAKPHGVKDTNTYWTLTPYGDETMTRLRAIKRTRVAEVELEPGVADRTGDH